MNRRKWLIIRDYCIGWTVSFLFLSIVRGVGTVEAGALQFAFTDSLLISSTLGPIIGFISGYFQVLSEEKFYKQTSIQRFLILRFCYAILFLITIVIIAYGVYQLYFGTEISLLKFAFDKGSFAMYFYILFVDFFMVVLRQVNLMLGPGNLAKLLRGKFYTPREEIRIFMFLDLQSSTSLAEKLGHIQYSMFIQDCFNDLGAVIKHHAEVYQYVGDEAVLTWELSAGLKNQNCLKAFYHFKQQLENRREHYLEKYGNHPFFKAGLHTGKVTVTEVGRYKKEIAYHGDTMNTTARIQGQCNNYGEELLISDNLLNQLSTSGYLFKHLGNISLKGKDKAVSVHGVTGDSTSQSIS